MTAPVSLKEYFAAAGSQFTKTDAEVIGSQFEVMAEAGPLDQRTIVDVARSANSPLNRFFEWDDAKAADLHRLDQAGSMMKSIRVRVMENERPRVTAAYRFAQQPIAKPAPKGYNVLHDESAAAAKMAVAAYDDLIAWRTRYGAYLAAWVSFGATFRQVTNQIGEFEDAGRPKGADVDMDDAMTALLSWREKYGSLAPRWEDLVEQVKFMTEAIDIAGSSLAAHDTSVSRRCLKCSTTFQSDGPGNRLCARCTRRSTKWLR